MIKSKLADLATLKSKLTDEQFRLVSDLLSAQESSWQQRLNQIPVLAPLLGTFGLVSTFYGFEKLLDRTFLIDQPWLLLTIGVLVLLATGVFYRKLQ